MHGNTIGEAGEKVEISIDINVEPAPKQPAFKPPQMSRNALERSGKIGSSCTMTIHDLELGPTNDEPVTPVTPGTPAQEVVSPTPPRPKTLVWSRKSPNQIFLFLYNVIMPFVAICTAASFAFYLKLPFLFPSLGPTAFLHFAIPSKAPSSPKNTLCGHLIGILAGSLSLQVFGLYDNPGTLIEGVTLERIICAGFSVGITCGLMVLLKVAHPPAGATTLIVSLGILKTPFQVGIMMAAVTVITIESFILNRLFRKDAIYPLWSASSNQGSAETPQENKFNAFAELDGYSMFQLNNMNVKYSSLMKHMADLTVENFVDAYEVCADIEDEEFMNDLIAFAVRKREVLNKMAKYKKKVPYALRLTVDNRHAEELLGCLSAL